MSRTRFGYIPHRIEIEGCPELSVFPMNVLFAQRGTREGRLVSGSALYRPDADTYESAADYRWMVYRNGHGGDNWLFISYDERKGLHEASKWIKGACVGIRAGKDWNTFFGKFTGELGLANTEMCEYRFLDQVPGHSNFGGRFSWNARIPSRASGW